MSVSVGDGSAVVVPVYFNPVTMGPQLEIYVSLNGGLVEPYSFDTGAPEFFPTYGAWWPGTSEVSVSGSGNFTFAQEPTYYYQSTSASVTVTNAAGTPAFTVTGATVAQVTNITVYGNGPSVETSFDNWARAAQGAFPLTNDTYGDFGAGLYGDSELGTILSQVSLSSDLEAGFIVEAPSAIITTSTTTSGTASTVSAVSPGIVTIGLTAATIAAWKSDPDTLILSMPPKGGALPSPDGTTAWASFNKAQAADTVVTLTSGGQSVSFDMGMVIDTDGGSSNNIYDTGDINLPSWASGKLEDIAYLLSEPGVSGGSSSTVLSYTASGSVALPAGGHTSGLSTPESYGDRDNPGYNLYLSYTVMFDVADDEVLLKPITYSTISSGTVVSGGSLVDSDRLTVSAGGTAIDFTVGDVALATVEGLASGLVLSGGYADVFSGGTAVGTVVTGGGTQMLSAGGSVVSTTVSAAGADAVSSGGTAMDTLVLSGGSEIVYHDGESLSAVVSAQGFLAVSAGGTALATTLDSGAFAVVSAGGVASGITVGSGADLVVLPGATVSATVADGGNLVSTGIVLYDSSNHSADLYGSATSGLVIGTEQTVYVLSGSVSEAMTVSGGSAITYGIVSGSVISANGTELLYGESVDTVLAAARDTVLSGGTAISTTINAAAVQTVKDGGTAFADYINSGGYLVVSSGGSSTDTLVDSGGVEVVVAGGSASGTIIGSSGVQLLSSGGESEASFVGRGGVEEISAGASASGSVLLPGGVAWVKSGGTETGATVNSGALQVVSAHGTAISTTVNSGGYVFVDAAGSASGVTVDSGGTLILAPGAQTSDIIQDGGEVITGGIFLETISGGLQSFSTLAANASGVTVGSTSMLVVFSGATATGTELSGGLASLTGEVSATQIEAGGTEIVNVGGTALADDVLSGGVQLILSGGTAMDTVVTSGGGEFIGVSGSAIGTVLQSGYEIVSSGGLDTGATVQAGGLQVILDGGTALSGTVASAGNQMISNGGDVESITLSGGTQTIFYGGYASGSIVEAGGFQVLSNAGVAEATVIASGGVQVVSQGAFAQADIVGSGGVAEVAAYGQVSGTTVSSGGYLLVSGGGTATNTTVESGGVLIVVSSGGAVSTTLSGGTVLSSGIVFHQSGGGYTELGQTQTGTTIAGEASAFVLADATVSATVVSGGLVVWGQSFDTQVLAGGVEVVNGIASATVVTGGDQVVSSGGVAIGTVIGTSGLMAIESGGSAAGAIVFSGGAAVLEIGGQAMPTVAISGFAAGDEIELANVAYSSAGSVTLGSGGILTVSENNSAYNVQLAGDYAGASFTLLSGNAGSATIVTLACFAAGTMIATPDGDRRVEQLVAGDDVLTPEGKAVPIDWCGHRRVDCAKHPKPESVHPVRIAADAFGPGLPRRPLWLSPDHAVFAEGVLIPVKHLINGFSIRQEPISEVTYFHIELPQHGIVLAEGLPAESYLDTGNRMSFAGTAMTLHPTWGNERQDTAFIFDSLGYAPLRVAGPEVDRLRTQLAARAAEAGMKARATPAAVESVR
ncbi:Hint domain-containing protein [Acidisoma silvae]|uniref:Hint domain-containing protein n=1 Tax=Acidisoma silvae TaxID=2802396 RepID=A0A964DXB5_9PROT|nr:Hint domain-containing protein [Acidisoma silvae]MCB8874036.1 Hint domain-containing protein [Acidisoma silvae]